MGCAGSPKVLPQGPRTCRSRPPAEVKVGRTLIARIPPAATRTPQGKEAVPLGTATEEGSAMAGDSGPGSRAYPGISGDRP
jgi:hypothetical protein